MLITARRGSTLSSSQRTISWPEARSAPLRPARRRRFTARNHNASQHAARSQHSITGTPPRAAHSTGWGSARCTPQLGTQHAARCTPQLSTQHAARCTPQLGTRHAARCMPQLGTQHAARCTPPRAAHGTAWGSARCTPPRAAQVTHGAGMLSDWAALRVAQARAWQGLGSTQHNARRGTAQHGTRNQHGHGTLSTQTRRRARHTARAQHP